MVEDYLMYEMKCKIRDKDTFRFVNLTSKSPNTLSRFLSALKSMNVYEHHNSLKS